MSDSTRAVVIVSGGAAVSPFTTPDVIAQQGMAAGSTATFLRKGLLDAGFTVFTSPASIGGGPALEDTEFSGFSDPAITLPAELTVNCVGPIDDAGQRLANFLEYVNETFGTTTFDLIGHSMGGLFSRASIHELTRRNSSLTVRSLATIGTPWQGSFAGDYSSGDVSIELADGDAVFKALASELAKLLAPSDLPLVISYELAHQADVHVHRVGRTGRAGKDGQALALVAPGEMARVKAIEEQMGMTARWQRLDLSSIKLAPLKAEWKTVVIDAGRKDKLRPGDILGALTAKQMIDGKSVGKIALFDTRSYVALHKSVADKALQLLRQDKIKGRSFRVRLLSPAV